MTIQRLPKAEYSWETFKDWLAVRYPNVLVPNIGHLKDFLDISEKHPGMRQRIFADVRVASGNCAWVIYKARHDGWWSWDMAVDDIRRAPGNRAMAICMARRERWWPVETFANDVRNAPGDQAWAIYLARCDGVWSPQTFVEDILNASGRRARAIFFSWKAGWWPDEMLTKDVKLALELEKKL